MLADRCATRGRQGLLSSSYPLGSSNVPGAVLRRCIHGVAVNARARSIATLDRIGRRTGCSRSFEGGGLKQRCLRENTPSTSARMDRRRPIRVAETSFGKVGEPLRHWTEVVARTGSENRTRTRSATASNPGYSGAGRSRVGEARCGGVGIDRPQYPRRRDHGYSACLGVRSRGVSSPNCGIAQRGFVGTGAVFKS